MNQLHDTNRANGVIDSEDWKAFNFINTIDVVIDGGSVPGSPSSVVSLIDDIPEIIRYGAGDVDIFE